MTPAVITLYRDLPGKDVDELLSLLDEAGIDAEVGPPHVRMGGAVEATVQILVQVSLENLGGILITAAGARLWKALRGLFDRDDEEGTGDRDEIVAVIVDPATGDRVELTRGALRQSSLPDLLDLVNGRPGDRPPLVIVWNETSGTWHIYEPPQLLL
ncbi:hypothetical protein ETD83_31980 [Actinomadura soli]|uniref:Uncharacterized protein n=1 Tax=Actinomadura soli TaxID=2508997 RepID=A0A5C4J370_9ACTN|nr:hypothetical protein [Actinomadura soli]TMQ91209.1 hypothetical protein ETD83_31980 [Actinomadura soli]